MEAIRLNKLYTLKEASVITGIHYRRIQRKAKKLGIKKLGREYMVDEEFMKEHFNVFLDKSVNSVKMETVKSLTVNKSVNRDVNSELLSKIDNLQAIIINHTKLFRIMATRLQAFESSELKDLSTEIKETTPEPPLQVYKSVHPEGKEIKNDKGEVTDIQPSMNDVNFQSNYNYFKKKDTD